MLEALKKIFGLGEQEPTVRNSEGIVYLGEEDHQREPDENGKSYTFFNLILEGEHKGKYSAGLVASKSIHRNNVRDAEALDIYESGYEIYAPDPFN